MKKSILFIGLGIWLMMSCNVPKNEEKIKQKDYILTEKDLIPEGVAYNEKTNTIYISSTHKRKIIQIDAEGNISDFVKEQQGGIWSVIGMEVDEKAGKLWANTAHANQVMPLVNPLSDKDWLTNVSSFDLKTGKLIKAYDLNVDSASFNDLTVAENGDIYITECINNKVYFIDHQKDQLEEFVEPKGFVFLNGITISKKHNALFVGSVQGLLRIDLKSKEYQLLENNTGMDDRGVDGLTIHENYLIGHLSSKITKFYINEEGTKVVSAKIFDQGKEFDSSTTGEIGNGYYHYIVNSQIQSGVDYQNRKIKPLDSLDEIIIRKMIL